jgi:hypothetical protein
LDIEGYRVKYAKTALGLMLGILKQAGRIKKAIKKEHEWLKQVNTQYHFDAIISDNRYGLHHENIPAVFITHQLQIKSPFGKWSEKWLQKKNYAYINQFTACWVPDHKNENSLAGALSHPLNLPNVPVTYIGPLSRFEKNEVSIKPEHLLILLSGPEPQRCILENKIINEISFYKSTATIVRGLPDAAQLIPSTNMIRFFNHLPAKMLNEEMQKASCIIARSGYSTVMDIAALDQKSILIPTPGQTEQEYLACYLAEKNFAPFILQNDFSISKALSLVNNFQYKANTGIADNELKDTVRLFVDSLKKKFVTFKI